MTKLKQIKGSDDSICVTCGTRVSSGNNWHECKPRPCKPLPSFFIRAVNFSTFLVDMVSLGFTSCTRQEISDRLDHCCPSNEKPCKYFHHIAHACTECGCYVNMMSHDQGMNMLAWKEKECPIGKFKKLADKP